MKEKKTVIVVNSDTGDNAKIEEILTGAGYKVKFVMSAEEALAASGEEFYRKGLSISYSSRTVKANGKKIHLTPIEFRMITLLAKNAGKVLTHEQIINEIWGPFNSDNLVLRVNIANIRKKIEPNPSVPVHILTEMGVGYRMAL